MSQLAESDLALIHEAREIIRKRYRAECHRVGAALRTRSGRVFAAVHLEAYVGGLSICAEAIAIGMAAAAGDADIDTIVAVRHTGQVVSPCGWCRELISDYGPNARVIVPSQNSEAIVAIGELLPNKYCRPE
jgi:cytidine deaminase